MLFPLKLVRPIILDLDLDLGLILFETVSERVPFSYGLIYTPKRASFDGDHRKRLGLVFAWGYTKKKN